VIGALVNADGNVLEVKLHALMAAVCALEAQSASSGSSSPPIPNSPSGRTLKAWFDAIDSVDRVLILFRGRRAVLLRPMTRKRKTMIPVILVFLLVVPGWAQKKRDWIAGRMVELSHSQKTEFSPVAAGRDPMAGVAVARVSWNLTVESDSMRHSAEKQGGDFPFRKGSAIQFALDKKDLILLDSKNREVRAKILKSAPLKKPQW